MVINKKIKGFLIGAASIAFGSLSAQADDAYISQNGYAASGYDVVAFFNIEQAPIGQMQPAPVPGNERFFTEYKGAKYVFSSMENRGRFLNDPERYVPAFDGHCSHAVGSGVKLPGNPQYWRIIDEKLYFVYGEHKNRSFERALISNILHAQDAWPEVESLPASRLPVPVKHLGDIAPLKS